MESEVRVSVADLKRPDHALALVRLLDEYARSEIGGDEPLPERARKRLASDLAANPLAIVFLAHAGDEAVGLAVCLIGYSTFVAAPLLNLHDLTVTDGWRGQGVGSLLLDHVEDKARELGCCRVTLEVREDNEGALKLYHRRGYHPRGPEEFFRVKEV